MSMMRSRIFVPSVLVLGVLAVLLAKEDAPDTHNISAVRVRQADQRSSAVAVMHSSTLDLSSLRKPAAPGELAQVETGALFASKSWYVAPPPPPPAKPLPPPKPAAPPLPFKYVGQYQAANDPDKVIILSRGARVYTVVEGELIDNLYSVGAITGNQLELTYIPLGIKQSLNLGSGI